MSYKTIGDTLYTKIQEAVGDDIASIYNYEISVDDDTLTPYVMVSPDGGRHDLLDNANDEAEKTFRIDIVDQRSTDRSDVESNMRRLIDAIYAKIKEIDQVNYSIGHGYPVSYSDSNGFYNQPEKMRVYSITVTFRCIEDN